jgi:carbamoyl-phosphate synthase small subunit
MRGVISTAESDPRRCWWQKAEAFARWTGPIWRAWSRPSRSTPFDSSDSRNQTGDPFLPKALVQNAEARKRLHVVAYDFGIKLNILRMLTREGCRVTVVPAETSAEDVFDLKPDGVFLSNGPGDPEPVDYAVRAIRKFLGRVPVFGICLGHQLTGLALGGKTYKLKFGHHGGNHPVRNNAHRQGGDHGAQPQLRRRSRLDQRQRGGTDPRGPERPDAGRPAPQDAAAVQRAVPPRSAPGPHDSHYLFRDFRRMMEEWKG